MKGLNQAGLNQAGLNQVVVPGLVRSLPPCPYQHPTSRHRHICPTQSLWKTFIGKSVPCYSEGFAMMRIEVSGLYWVNSRPVPRVRARSDWYSRLANGQWVGNRPARGREIRRAAPEGRCG